jgi:hypothetical protein
VCIAENLHFSLSYLLKPRAVCALPDLTNERPIAEQRGERCHVVYSSLKQPFALLLFLLATVKHKRFAVDEGEVLSFIHRLFLTWVVFGNVSSIENPSFRTA